MRFISMFRSVFPGSRGTAHEGVPGAPVTALGRRVVRADLNIQQQADQALANKQARELREDRCAAHACGCPQCRQAYRLTLAFYAGLGRRPLTREGAATRALTRYSRPGGDPAAPR